MVSRTGKTRGFAIIEYGGEGGPRVPRTLYGLRTRIAGWLLGGDQQIAGSLVDQAVADSGRQLEDMSINGHAAVFSWWKKPTGIDAAVFRHVRGMEGVVILVHQHTGHWASSEQFEVTNDGYVGYKGLVWKPKVES